MAASASRRTLEQLLQDAAARIDRLDPLAARAAVVEHDALIVDIRSASDRARDGIVPGSLHIPRTVLEWRLAPDSAWRNPSVPSVDQQLVLLCDHGCSSILAAATLVDLGFTRVADVVGGFAAWRKAGLPTAQLPMANPLRPDELPGMRPPDL